jgi:ASC-1-like (ASCH) protein
MKITLSIAHKVRRGKSKEVISELADELQKALDRGDLITFEETNNPGLNAQVKNAYKTIDELRKTKLANNDIDKLTNVNAVRFAIAQTVASEMFFVMQDSMTSLFQRNLEKEYKIAKESGLSRSKLKKLEADREKAIKTFKQPLEMYKKHTNAMVEGFEKEMPDNVADLTKIEIEKLIDYLCKRIK